MIYVWYVANQKSSGVFRDWPILRSAAPQEVQARVIYEI